MYRIKIVDNNDKEILLVFVRANPGLTIELEKCLEIYHYISI